MSVSSQFIKSSGFYFLGNVLSKLILFFLLPIYTSYISPEHLGYYDVSYTCLNLLTTFLFVDIYVGIMRFIFDAPTITNIKKPVFNGLIIFCVSLFLFTILAITLWISFDIQYIGYVYLYGVFLTINNLFGYLVRALGFNKLYALSGVVATFVIGALNIIGIVFMKGGIEVLYISSIIGLLTQVIIQERKIHIRRYISFRFFDKALLSELFYYSIPLSLNSLAFWLLTGYTNVAISRLLGLDANGIYIVAAKFGVAISLLSTCFNLAWQEIAFKKGLDDKKELGQFYSHAINLLIKFFSLWGICLIPVCFIIFPFVVKGDYASSLGIIPLCIIVAILSVISSFLGQVYAAIKATKEIMRSTITACILNLVLVPLFISFAGLWGAIVGMIISYLVNVIMRIVILRKYVNISINCKHILFSLLLMTLALFVFYWGNEWNNMLLFIAISALSLYLFRDMLKSIINNIRMNL